MRFLRAIGTAALCAGLGMGRAQAGTIQVTSVHGTIAISGYQPIGQTFTAIDSSLTSIGFSYNDLNASSANDPITMSLYAGVGTGGTLLATRTFTLPAVLPGVNQPVSFTDTNFGGLGLTIGSVYTAALTTSNSFKVGIEFAGSDVYAGGSIFNGGGPAVPDCATAAACDLDFRVIGTTAVAGVPEPASWTLMIAAFGAMGGVVGYRRRRATA